MAEAIPNERLRHLERIAQLEAQLGEAKDEECASDQAYEAAQEVIEGLRGQLAEARQQSATLAEQNGKLRDALTQIKQVASSGARILAAEALALPVPTVGPHLDSEFLAWLRRTAPETMKTWEKHFRESPDLWEECLTGVDDIQEKHPDTVRLDATQLESLAVEWVRTDGKFYDPDTGDVDWFDKRIEAMEYAFVAGYKAAIDRASGRKEGE